MQITIIVDDSQTWPLLHRIAEQRGCGVPALVMSFVGKELGQICLPCAGMGFGHDDTNICTICGGDGLNPFIKPKAREPLRICTNTGCSFQAGVGNIHDSRCPEFRR
jgi:hypothetical protein